MQPNAPDTTTRTLALEPPRCGISTIHATQEETKVPTRMMVEKSKKTGCMSSACDTYDVTTIAVAVIATMPITRAIPVALTASPTP